MNRRDLLTASVAATTAAAVSNLPLPAQAATETPIMALYHEHRRITADAARLERYAMEGKAPRTALVITIDTVYFQCSRALHRSRLWDPSLHRVRSDLPTPGQMLKGAKSSLVAEDYDKGLDERLRTTLY